MLTRTIAIIFGVAAVAVLNALVSQPPNGENLDAQLAAPAQRSSPTSTLPDKSRIGSTIQHEPNAHPPDRYVQQPAALAKQRTEIRDVDFGNLTYPPQPIYSSGKFNLTDGHYKGRPGIPGAKSPYGDPYPVGLAAIGYGDVTGDGNEEAIVVLSESVAGTAIPYYIYVYTMEKTYPKLLWAVATGDRAEGGPRNVYAQSGELVIELYGKGARVNGNVFAGDGNGACCPLSVTRTRYRWRKNRFAQHGTSEIFPSGGGGASFKMEYRKGS